MIEAPRSRRPERTHPKAPAGLCAAGSRLAGGLYDSPGAGRAGADP